MAGKSFADLARESVQKGDAKRILNRIKKIKNNADLSNSNLASQQPNKSTSQQLPEQPSEQLSKQVDKSANQQLPEHVDKSTSEQVINITSRQVNKSTNKQVGNSYPQQVNKSTTYQVDDLTSEQVEHNFDFEKCPKDLKLNQFRILFEIYFKRPFKVHGPNRIGTSSEFKIPYGTVRYILMSLVKKGYISKPFSINNGVVYGTTCQINEEKCIPLFGPSNIINSQQINKSTFQQVDNLTSQQFDNHISNQFNKSANQQHIKLTDQQVNKSTSKQQSASNKLVSKYLNKLTDYIENSTFWNKEGLTVKKCEQWLNEFEFLKNDSDLLITQLRFAEKTKSVLEPKSKTPVHVFYGCLKNGGLTRPKDFLFPEEKAMIIRKQELEAKEKLLAEQAAIREKELKIADELAFTEFINEKENIDSLIAGIETKFITPKKKNSIKIYRKNGQIDSTLYNALKIEFNRVDDE